ncbi:MAG: TylF/MycF/NovP-related O-methyltransferase [Gammaproteobacteria bacterium]|nr:TylF/MycF/NovP-related O-methyltransferase [Gammaproteobacteria bacterium]
MADPKLADDFLRTLGRDEGPFEEIWARCAPYTMTSPERGVALFRAVNYLVSRNVPGAIVECGTWRGGSAMIAMMTLRHHGVDNRPIYLFDTFEGMTNPSDIDVDLHGRSGQKLLEREEPETSLTWAKCSVEDVKRNLAAVDYPFENVHLINGDVRTSLEQTSTGAIALLRLDTDFYDSTMAELRHLYPRLLQHGVILIDDYGHWRGCRRAVDEFFITSSTEASHEPIRPFFHSIDYTARIGIRSQANSSEQATRYDYIPRGMEAPALLKHFPTLMETDPAPVSWPYLRKSIPHIWRTDCRTSKPNIGVLGLEEATILYNCARSFEGRRGLEIGCHLGWSTAHILAAGVRLDVIDPALGTKPHFESVRYSLEQAGSGLLLTCGLVILPTSYLRSHGVATNLGHSCSLMAIMTEKLRYRTQRVSFRTAPTPARLSFTT